MQSAIPFHLQCDPQKIGRYVLLPGDPGRGAENCRLSGTGKIGFSKSGIYHLQRFPGWTTGECCFHWHWRAIGCNCNGRTGTMRCRYVSPYWYLRRHAAGIAAGNADFTKWCRPHGWYIQRVYAPGISSRCRLLLDAAFSDSSETAANMPIKWALCNARIPSMGSMIQSECQ